MIESSPDVGFVYFSGFFFFVFFVFFPCLLCGR